MASVLTTDTTAEVITWRSARQIQASDAWDYLATVDTLAPVFCYREWFQLADEAGALGYWATLIIYRDDRPIALFPLSKPSPWSWQVISFFGQGDMQALIDPAQEDAAWHGLADWLASCPGVRMFSLEISGNERAERFTNACRLRHINVNAGLNHAPLVLSRLETSWPAFEKKMGSAAKNCRRAERLLREGYPDYTIEYLTAPEACLKLLPELIRQYRVRWGHRPSGCQFDNPRNVEFYHRAVAWAAERGYLVMSVLRTEGRPIVLHAMFHLPGQEMLYQHTISRDMDALPNRYSPGIVESTETARWAIARGITWLNQGVGALPYKMMLAGEEHPRWKLTAARSPLAHQVLPRIERGLHIATRLPVYAAYYTHLRR